MKDHIYTTVPLSTKKLIDICLELKEFREGKLIQGKYILPIPEMMKIKDELKALRQVAMMARHVDESQGQRGLGSLGVALCVLDELRKANEI